MCARKVWAVAAALGWLALGMQLYVVLGLRWSLQASLMGGVVSFFSYFTVLSNTLAASLFTAAACRNATVAACWLRRPAVAAGITCSMLLVGGTYRLLLRNLEQPEGWEWWANELLHGLLPLLCLVFWLKAVPRGYLRLWHVPLWALYPLGYFAFTLVRGKAIGVWPYPFVDVSTLGMALVLRNALGVLVGFLGLALVLWAVDRYSSSEVPAARQ